MDEKLGNLFTALAMVAGHFPRGVAPQVANPLVTLLPKFPVSCRYPRWYPHCSEGEQLRRIGQILRGTLRPENGLARNGQLVSRPDGSIQVRRPY